ncbi:unnamed protein product [Gemmata massiliana]|uniref:Uncharacterized protein n=1 Tax=Gemmata massiliana TaxID=1210884 RepID=A0A6P2CPT7_9BACT|nr:hypothetical protein [Gemmata massiliana]VTR90961.1 unnamed protein product [Gemmata massiliana]
MFHPRLARLVPCAALTCAFVLTAPTALPAPVPKHLMPKDEPVCFPTRVGDRMVSLWQGKELICVVTKVEKTNDGISVTQEYEDERGVRTHDQTVVASAVGLKVVRYSDRDLDKSVWWLKLPHVDNNTWTDNLHGQETRTLGWEEIEVPAGKFKAIRVDRNDNPNGTAKTSYWYAPGLGCIKWSDGTASRVLTAFKPGN